MSRELGVEFARRGVRVNALCPGPVNTPLLQELFAKDPEKAARRLVHLPMGRFAEAARDRAGGAVPGERRVLLRDRLDVPGGRRPLGRLRHARVALARKRSQRARPTSFQSPIAARVSRRSASGSTPMRTASSSRAVVVDPGLRVRARHLGVELDAPRASPDAEGLQAHVAAGERRSRPAAAGTRSCATGTPRSAGRAVPSSGSSRPRRVTSTSCQPISGRAPGAPARPPPRPAAAPRGRRPSSGTSRSSRSRSSAFSSRSHGCRSSWSACIAPPKTSTAS